MLDIARLFDLKILCSLDFVLNLAALLSLVERIYG